MTLDEPGTVVMGSEPVLDVDRVIGYVTSADYGCSVDTGIAYSYLPTTHTRIGTRVEILYMGSRRPATVASKPLSDLENLRVRS